MAEMKDAAFLAEADSWIDAHWEEIVEEIGNLVAVPSVVDFDAATPEPYRRRIASYRAVCPRFEAVYYTAAQTACLTESLRGTIRSVLAAEHGSTPPLTVC